MEIKRKNHPGDIMIPILLITLLLFPYLTLRKQILPMFQSFTYKHTFDKVMPSQTVL